ATLVRRPEDVPAYDRAFAAFWGDGSATEGELATRVEIALATDAASDGDDADEDGGDQGPMLAVRYSAMEVLRTRDFATYTTAEHDEARRLMADVRLAGALRRSRRTRASGRRGPRLDVRRTVRGS